ncbi:MAG TPA: hypothetical protein VMD76_13880 [Candidatus Sulfotelmatobacter sp.]|nr:hypothetical protein [Candidatus Sulfotelmatobacter sp.]
MDHILAVGEFQLCPAIFVIFDEPNWFSDNLSDRPLVLRRKIVQQSGRDCNKNCRVASRRFFAPRHRQFDFG